MLGRGRLADAIAAGEVTVERDVRGLVVVIVAGFVGLDEVEEVPMADIGRKKRMVSVLQNVYAGGI